MISRRLSTAYAFLAFLHHDAPWPRQLRRLLAEQRRFPSRRTWERRRAARPSRLPGLMGSVGRHVVLRLQPWATPGRAVACASTPLATGGGVWHTKQREQGGVPHRAMDTQAGWSTSGGHGWWDGWKRPLAVTVGSVWRPLAAELTVAHRADNEVAPLLLAQRPGAVRDVRGDTHDHDSDLRQRCHPRGCELVATRRGPSPHRAGGVEVRKVCHKLRAHALAPFNGWFTNVVDWRVKMPVKGVQRSQLLAWGAVVVYQLVLRYQHEPDLPLGKGIKPFLRAA